MKQQSEITLKTDWSRINLGVKVTINRPNIMDSPTFMLSNREAEALYHALQKWIQNPETNNIQEKF